jgi:hypothetical protein
MSFHVPNTWRVREGVYASDDEAGNNGAFRFMGHGPLYAWINTIASDGAGWEHVSVSIDQTSRCPTWEEMCMIARIFWDDSDVLVQYRPAAENYVNCHPYVLHWWRPIGVELPTPEPILVGPK